VSTEPQRSEEATPPEALFSAELAQLEDRLAVPYPDRALLLEELAGDLGAAYGGLRARGVDPETARQEALRSLQLDEETLRALEDVHVPAVQRALSRLPPPVRQWLEITATALPLFALFLFLVEEVPLNLFLSQGGRANYFVLAVGALGLFIEMQRLFIWFVLRDHSIAALRRNTPTPLYLAAATALLGVLGTSIELYGGWARSGCARWGECSPWWSGPRTPRRRNPGDRAVAQTVQAERGTHLLLASRRGWEQKGAAVVRGRPQRGPPSIPDPHLRRKATP
jgi:hypothetical protein